MKLLSATAMMLGFSLLLFLAQTSHAGVFLCEDPITGKKTFTDKACPGAGKRTKVRIEPTNFGQGQASRKSNSSWNSQRDTSVAGRANFGAHSGRLNAARGLSAPGG